jgi:hypothetical protein
MMKGQEDTMRTKHTKHALAALLAVAPLLVAAPLSHAEVRYEYTGGALTDWLPSLFASTDRVAAWFTLVAPAPSGDFSAADFIDYGFSIGGLSLTRAGGADAGAHLEFAPDGAITSWSFVVGDYTPPYADPSAVELSTNSADLVPAGDRVLAYTGGATVLGAYAALPGTWTLSAVPEPATAALFLCGALIVVLGACAKENNTAT